jgi:hypothetical protein
MEILKRFALWFVSGAALILGAMAAYFAVDAGKEFLIEPPSVRVQMPKELSVSNVEPLEITKPAGVRALVTNTSSTTTYEPAGYALQFFRGQKQLFSCEAYLERPNLKPGKSAEVQVVCPQVERSALPSDVTYTLIVQSAWKFK